jgi:hypothetical protein
VDAVAAIEVSELARTYRSRKGLRRKGGTTNVGR